MKILVIFLSSVLAGLLFGSAHADNNAAASLSAQAASPPQRGTLYRVRHHGNTSWLFGTIHVGMPAFFPLEAQVTQALSRATKLVLEIDIRDSRPFKAALQKHGFYANEDTLERHLSADTLAQLRPALQRFDMPFEQVSRMKPWLLANMLTGLDLARNGYHYANGVEHFLLSFTGGAPKTVEELESAEYQMSLFDSMTDAVQEQYLREHLAELGDGDALKKAVALIDAWASADGNVLEQLWHESLQEKTASAEFTHRVLLGKRNPEMADKIEALLKNDESTFVGVGLLHLMGETGVPRLLRQRGYEVEKLY